MTITPYDEPMSYGEQTDLVAQESAIEIGMRAFHLAGNALTIIRDARLYRAQYATFEAYCQGRWGMTHRHANRLIEASEVVENLGPIGPILPVTESQARPLAQLTAADQPAVWQEAVETAPEGRITAAHVERTVERFRRPEPAQTIPTAEPTPLYPRPLPQSEPITPDAIVAPPAQDITALVIDDDLRTLERRRIVAHVLDRMYSVVREAAPLMRVADPDELAPLLSEYQVTEEPRLMPTFAWVQAIFDARRAAQNIRRVK